LSSTKDESDVSSDINDGNENIVQSSVVAPGFELLVGLVGLYCASRF
jgi:hypothetical protein